MLGVRISDEVSLEIRDIFSSRRSPKEYVLSERRSTRIIALGRMLHLRNARKSASGAYERTRAAGFYLRVARYEGRKTRVREEGCGLRNGKGDVGTERNNNRRNCLRQRAEEESISPLCEAEAERERATPFVNFFSRVPLVGIPFRGETLGSRCAKVELL